jgi:hypothetical protein
MTNDLIDRIKAMHKAETIENKDYSLKQLFKNDNDVVQIEVVGLSSKRVPKYISEENDGYHTTLYLKNGEITGCFSGALHEFANFFYRHIGLDTTSDFNKVTFDGFITVKITKIDLKKGRTTYNFEVIDGELRTIERSEMQLLAK